MSAPRTGSAAKSRPGKPASAAPVQLKKRSATVAREPLFAIDDVEYTMPAVVEFGDALRLGAVLRLQVDENAKGMTLVRNLCGDKALEALLGDATMTRAEWMRIVGILTDKVFGPAEAREDDGQGN